MIRSYDFLIRAYRVPLEISYDAFFKMIDSEEPWFICEKECKFL